MRTDRAELNLLVGRHHIGTKPWRFDEDRINFSQFSVSKKSNSNRALRADDVQSEGQCEFAWTWKKIRRGKGGTRVSWC
jgi:hypothetical protein